MLWVLTISKLTQSTSHKRTDRGDCFVGCFLVVFRCRSTNTSRPLPARTARPAWKPVEANRAHNLLLWRFYPRGHTIQDCTLRFLRRAIRKAGTFAANEAKFEVADSKPGGWSRFL